MKKILQITVRSDEGGGPKHVAQILEHLSGEFEFYTASPYDPPYFEIYSQNSAGHFFLPHRKASLLKAFDLLFWCRDNKIDTVHTHGRGAAFYGFFLELLGIKTIHTFHGVHPKTSFLQRSIQFLERIIYIFYTNLIFVSQSEKEQAEKCGFITFKSSSIIPNGVDVAAIQEQYNSLTKEEARNRFKLPKEAKVLGTLSRLDPHKQNDKLINALNDLPEEYHIAIAGDGEQEETLKQLTSHFGLDNRVHFLGRISNPITFLRAIDTYVSWSKGEGHPYSVLEAISCNKSILLSKVPGHIDMVSKVNLFKDKNDFLAKINQAQKELHPKDVSISNTLIKIKLIYLSK